MITYYQKVENDSFYLIQKITCDICGSVVKDREVQNYYWTIRGIRPVAGIDTGIRDDIDIDLCEDCFQTGFHNYLEENGIDITKFA
jgi:hypothetical protein